MKKDVIKPVKVPTPWVSPTVVVPKPSGERRLCDDTLQSSEAVVRERHPIPTINQVLQTMNGSTMFSKLDLKWGFHQIQLAEESREIKTFSTHVGLNKYCCWS